MILIFGATGTIGRELVTALSGRRVRVFKRTESNVSSFDSHVEVYKGDINCERCLRDAMQGVDRIFSLAIGPELASQERSIAQAAKAAGVQHIVKLSVLGASREGIGVAAWHGAGEREIEQSGVAWTHLRPGAFMSNNLFWRETVKKEGKVYSNFGAGALAIIHPRDIAFVAARTLTEPGHEGKAYSLTGAEALSVSDQVAILADAIHRPLRLVEVDDVRARSLMKDVGMPTYLVDALIAFAPFVRAGKAAGVTDTVREVTGNMPLLFKEWARENAELFQ